MKKVVGVVAMLMIIGFAGCKKENSCGCEEAFQNANSSIEYVGSIFDNNQNVLGIHTIGKAIFTPDAQYSNKIFPAFQVSIDTSGGNEGYFDKPINVTFKVFEGSSQIYSATHVYSDYTYSASRSLLKCIGYNHLGWDGGTAKAGHYNTKTTIEFYDGAYMVIKDITCLVRSECCDSKSFYQYTPFISGYSGDDLTYDPSYNDLVRTCY